MSQSIPVRDTPPRPPQLRDAAVVGFGLVMSLLVIGGVLGYWNARRLDDNRRKVAHTHEVIAKLDTLQSTLKDVEMGTRGSILAEDDRHLRLREDALRRLRAETDRIATLVSDNSDQQAQLAALDARIAVRLDELKRLIEIAKAGDKSATLKAVRGDFGTAIMDAVRGDLAAMRGAEEELLKRRDDDSASSHVAAILSIVVPALVGVVLVGVVFHLSLRGIRQRHRTASALAEEKERLRTTLASIGDAVISTDVDGDVAYLNPVAETLTGWTNAEAMGEPLTRVFDIVNESTRRPVENPALRALRDGVVVGLANHTVLIARDGSERPIDDSAAPIRSVGGELVGCVLVFRDIAERKREETALAERTRLAALRAEVGAALSDTRATPLCLRDCCEALVRRLDAAFARIWTLDDAGAVLELQASAGLYTHLDGPHGRVPVGRYKIGRIAGNRRPHLSNSVPDDPEVGDRAWAAREGMIAFAGYPLMVEGRVVGVVAMFARRPLTEGVLTELAPLADGVAQFIDRRRAEELFRRQAELTRTTLASIGDAVLTTDADGAVSYLNAVAESLTGWTSAEAAGMPLESVFRIVDETTRAPAENPAARALRDGVVVGLANHTVLIARDGSERPIDDSAAPIRGAAGEIVGCVLVFRDIAERRRAEAALTDARRRLASTLAAGEIGTWEYDVAADRVRADHNLARMFGVFPIDAEGGPLAAYLTAIHADDRDRVAATIGRSMESDDAYEAEYRLALPGDAVRWVSARGRVERDAAGRPVRLPGVVVDITRRRAAEDRLRESEERRRLALDAAESGAWNIDLATNAMVADERFQAIFRGSVGELGFDEAVALIHPEDRGRVLDAVAAATRPDDPPPYAEEYRVVWPDGTIRWVFAKGRVRFGGGRLGSFDGTVSDVTDRKRTEEAIRESERRLRDVAARLADADHRKDEFLATLAHELRNPLAPIRNGLQVMRLAKGDADAVERSRAMIERQLEQMVRLVDDLMDVSRISRGRLELRMERARLDSVVAAAVETSRPLIDQMGHELTIEMPPSPIVVEADPTRLAQVFMNLLNNAAKYSERGGRIRLTAVARGGEVEVAVRDAGIGIAADQLPRVFEMFSQVDHAIERSQGGLGIGLSLVRSLVEMHGGAIEARSDGPGRGSEFVVRLPIVEAPAPGAPAIEDGPSAARSALRVLVVDDNRDGADSLAALLRFLGHETRTVYDGEEAVAVAREFRPAAVLLDIGLPKLNGYEACRRIREQPGGQDLVMIAQTGWGQDEDRRRTSDAGFDHHLVKPLDPSALVKLLAGLSAATD